MIRIRFTDLSLEHEDRYAIDPRGMFDAIDALTPEGYYVRDDMMVVSKNDNARVGAIHISEVPKEFEAEARKAMLKVV